MTRTTVTLLLIAAVAPASDPPATPTHQARLNGHTFTLPAGLEVDLVAGPDLVKRPIAAAFDDAGGLYVTEASGTNDPTPKQLAEKPHRVVKLTDKDGDGKFDAATVFAEKLMLPQGIMYLNGSVYVGNPPEITKFTDTDGDGKADKREVWFDGKTLTGCANDLHGPYLGPDGWVYWTKGAFAKQEYTLPSGKKFVTRASHIFRARPDGTGIEPVMTGGMDNPVDVTFLPNGDMFFTTTFFQHPANGRRDGIIHATYGAVYGKDHDPLYDHPWTGPELSEPMTHLGAAAPCGLHCYASDALGPGYRGNLFACCFNMQKVTRHVLTPHGSTYRTTDSDFLASDNRDFHPTDVLESADGSLLVVDTGGWYKLCCPTSQLVKPDVLGGIYRVRKAGMKATPVRQRRVTVHPPPQSPVGTIALQLASASHRDRRIAAERLGRRGDATAVPTLLAALADDANDRVLDTALTRALIDIGDATAVSPGLASPSPRVKRAALAALENIRDGIRNSYDVVQHLSSPDAALRNTAWWVAGRHPDWGREIANHYFKAKLGGKPLTAAERDQLVHQLAKFARSPGMQQFLADQIGNRFAPPDVRVVALTAAVRAGLRSPPWPWYVAAGRAMTACEPEVIRAAVALVRTLPLPTPTPLPDGFEALYHIPRNPKLPPDVRFQALAVTPVPGGPGQLEPELAAELVAAVHRDKPAAVRTAAAAALSKVTLDKDQLLALATALKTAAPMELDRLLEPFARSTDEKVGVALLDALQASPLRTSLRVDMLKPRLAKYPPVVQARAESLYSALNADLAGQRAKLEALLAETTGGDVRRGQLVFNSPKAACIACHSMGYLGGKVGPDLTRIGGVRTERDLLEAIVFPSMSFVRSYEPVKVTTLDGKSFSGILRKDAPDEVVLAASATEEVRIARADIDELTPGTVSVMPSGLDQQLSKQDLADLIAFLKASK